MSQPKSRESQQPADIALGKLMRKELAVKYVTYGSIMYVQVSRSDTQPNFVVITLYICNNCKRPEQRTHKKLIEDELEEIKENRDINKADSGFGSGN